MSCQLTMLVYDINGEPLSFGHRAPLRLARHQLELAAHASSGRSGQTVYGGHEHVLRQTVIALVAGATLDEHENPGEATIHVLSGRVRLTAGENGWEGSAGDLLTVPDARHALEALESSTILLTVAKNRPGGA